MTDADFTTPTADDSIANWPRRIRVKICCIRTVQEAKIAVGAGADALGLVSAMPSGPGVADDATLREIAACVPPGIQRFLLTAKTDVSELIQQQGEIGADTIQLVREPLAPESYRTLRESLPGIRWVQVIHVESEASIVSAKAVAPHVDALLLDSGVPSAEVPELGGTGRVHDWSLSARIVEECRPTPVFLAGGLHPENVTAAVEAVKPFGVDVCSGLRSDDRLVAELAFRFVKRVQEI